MNSDPLSNGLRATAERYEDSYSATGARPSAGLASRVLRRRITTIMAASALSLGLVAGSGIAVARILDSAPTDSTDPVAPPVPEGYERVVIPLDTFSVNAYTAWSDDPVFDSLGLTGSCGNVLHLAPEDDSGPFHLAVTSVTPSNIGSPPPDEEWFQTDAAITATLSYDGSSSGVVVVNQGAWVILHSDQRVASSMMGSASFMSSESTVSLNRLSEPFSLNVVGMASLWDCLKVADSDWDPSYLETVLFDPGSYSVVAAAKVEWSAEGAVILNADRLGYDTSWFRMGWRDIVPCQDAITKAKRNQNGNPIECVPNLYYQQLFDEGDYAIVDVPSDFFDGPRKTWYVVSDPYPIELPLDSEPPTT